MKLKVNLSGRQPDQAQNQPLDYMRKRVVEVDLLTYDKYFKRLAVKRLVVNHISQKQDLSTKH
jgi:hypothetical protein